MPPALKRLLPLVLLLEALACRPPEPVARIELADPPVLRHGEVSRVEVRYRSLRRPDWGPCPPTLFVHLLDPSGRLVRTFDHRPPPGPVGTVQRYGLSLFLSALEPPVAPGRYPLALGVYDPRSGVRWPAVVDGSPVHEEPRRVGSVVVAEATAPLLEVTSSQGWQAPPEVNTKQYAGRMWFEERATLDLGPLPPAGSLWLLLRIPKEPAESAEPSGVLDAEKTILLGGSCLAEPRLLCGSGQHEVEIPVPGPGRAVGCRLSLTASYSFRLASWPEGRSGSLEALAWRQNGGRRLE